MHKLFVNTPWGQRPDLEEVERFNDSIPEDDLETPYLNDYQLYFDNQRLNGWLMFWDELCIPDYADFPLKDSGPVGEYLEQRGILRRAPMFMDQMHGDGPTESEAHFCAFHQLDEQEPGVWSFAIDNDFGGVIPPSFEVPNRGLFIRLVDTLPVPSAETPLDEILDYKARHEAELIELRDAINDVYQSILSAPDRQLAENIKMKKLLQTSRNHLRAAEGVGLTMIPMNVEARFNLAGAAWAGIFNFALGGSYLQIAGNSILAGARVEMGPTMGLKKKNDSANPYAYLLGFYRDVFRSGAAHELLESESQKSLK